jgi:hypothetical protein
MRDEGVGDRTWRREEGVGGGSKECMGGGSKECMGGWSGRREEGVRGGSGRLEVGSVGEGRERRTIFRLWRMHSFSLSAMVQMK